VAADLGVPAAPAGARFPDPPSSSASPPCTCAWSRRCARPAPDRPSAACVSAARERPALSRDLRRLPGADRPCHPRTLRDDRDRHEPLEPYAGPRVPGQVGTPLPGVSIRIVTWEEPVGKDRPAGERGSSWCAARTSSRATGGRPRRPRRASSTRPGPPLVQDRRPGATGPATGAVTLRAVERADPLRGFNVYRGRSRRCSPPTPEIRERAVVGRPHPSGREVPGPPSWWPKGARRRRALPRLLQGAARRVQVPRTFAYLASLPRNRPGQGAEAPSGPRRAKRVAKFSLRQHRSRQALC